MPTLSELQAAIRARDLPQVKTILAAAPALAAERPAGSASATLLAVYVGSSEMVDLLMPLVTPDACEAAALGAADRLHQLLDADPSQVNARSGDGWTPLHLAGFFGRREAAELLLARGAPVAAVADTPDRNQPLQASLSGNLDEAIVRALVAHGADVNAAGASGVTALHSAAARGSETMVRFLLEHGARANATLGDGRTPADLADERGHAAVRDLLRAVAGGSAESARQAWAP